MPGQYHNTAYGKSPSQRVREIELEQQMRKSVKKVEDIAQRMSNALSSNSARSGFGSRPISVAGPNIDGNGPGAVVTGRRRSMQPRSNNTTPSASTKKSSATAQPSKAMHTVKKGDTLWGIATANGMSVNELLRRNPDLAKRKDNAIYAGDKINLTSTPVKAAHTAPARPKSESPQYKFKKASRPQGYSATSKLTTDIRNGKGLVLPQYPTQIEVPDLVLE